METTKLAIRLLLPAVTPEEFMAMQPVEEKRP